VLCYFLLPRNLGVTKRPSNHRHSCHPDNSGHAWKITARTVHCLRFGYTLQILLMPEPSQIRLDRVLDQLRLYEHPLLNFSARAKGDSVEIIIQFKDETVPLHTYYFDLHPRDLDHSQFEWSFQRQLFDALHDYFMEMFIRTPQDRADRREKGL